MRPTLLRAVTFIPALTAFAWLAGAATPTPSPAAEPAGSFTAKVTVALVSEADWQSELSQLRHQPEALLPRLNELAGEGNDNDSGQAAKPLYEVICPLPDGVEYTFTSGGRKHTLHTGFEQSREDPAKLEPDDDNGINPTTGTEVTISLARSEAVGSIHHLRLALTHLYEEPASHAVVYGAAATTAEERQKLSVPLPVLSEITWDGEVTLQGDTPRMVACVLRHPGKGGDAKANAQAQRCLIFIQSVPAQP